MRGMVSIGALVLALLPASASAQSVDTSQAVTIHGSPGDDQIYVSGLGPVSGQYRVSTGATELSSGIFPAATSITVDAGAGNDTISIGNPEGSLLAPPFGITVKGGDGLDTVDVYGGRSADGSYDHAPTAGPGTQTVTHTGAGTQRIVLDSVDGVDDSVDEQTWSYHGTDGSDVIGTVDGGLVPSSTTLSCCYPAYLTANGKTITPTNKATIDVDTRGSGATPDVVNLDGYQPLADQLNVDDGLPAPEDTVHLSYSPGRYAPDLGSASRVSVRAAYMDGNTGSHDAAYIGHWFRGDSLALDVTTLAPLEGQVPKLEIQAVGDVSFKNTVPLQIGGVSPTMSGLRSSAGSVSAEAPGKISVAPGDEAKGRDVTLTSDTLSLLGGAAAAGTVRLRPRSAGLPVGLGSPDDLGGSYNVSAADLRGVDAPAVEIGSHDSGLLSVTAPVATRSELSLESGGGFTATPGGAVQAAGLRFVDLSPAARAWTASATSVRVAPGAAIPYSATRFLALQASTAADSFDVTASPVVPIGVNGGDPTTAPGDSLTYRAEGRAASGDTSPPNGQIDSPNVKPVTFEGIEQLAIAP
jgi:hypothetical protein